MDTIEVQDVELKEEAMRNKRIEELTKQLAFLKNTKRIDKLKDQQKQLLAKLSVVNAQLDEYRKLAGIEPVAPLETSSKTKLISNGAGRGRGRQRSVPRLTIHFNDGQNYEMNPVGSKLTLAKAMLEHSDIEFAMNEKNKIIAWHHTFGKIYFGIPFNNTSGFKTVTVKKY